MVLYHVAKKSSSEDRKVSTWQIVLWVIVIVLAAILVALFFIGRRLEKKQAEQQEQIEAAKQSVTFLVLDKKRLRLTESKLPQQVIDATPWYLRRSKLPIVMVRFNGQVMRMISDEAIFDLIPVGKEVRATVSGLYITDVKGIRGALDSKPVKKGWFQKVKDKAFKARDEQRAEQAAKKGEPAPKSISTQSSGSGGGSPRKRSARQKARSRAQRRSGWLGHAGQTSRLHRQRRQPFRTLSGRRGFCRRVCRRRTYARISGDFASAR